MKNLDVRFAAQRAGIQLWALADFLGVSAATMTRMLRRELEEPEKARLLEGIEQLRREKIKEGVKL